MKNEISKSPAPAWYLRVLSDIESGQRPQRESFTKEQVEQAERRFRSAFERKSPETIETYCGAAIHFGRFLGIKKASVTEIIYRFIPLSRNEAETLIENYIKWMDENLELAPSTINTYLSALKFFLKTSFKVGWLDYEINVDGVKPATIKDVRGPTSDEIEKILDVVDELEGRNANRDRLLVYMLLFMGLRVSSVLTLDTEHLDMSRKGANFRLKGGGKIRKFKSIPPKTWEALEDWMNQKYRGEEWGPGPIITNFQNGKRLSRQSVDRILKKIGKDAGIELKLHAHAFRHASATEGLEVQEGNIRSVMNMTDHKSEAVFHRYDDDSYDRAGETMRKLEKKFLKGNKIDDDDVVSAAEATDNDTEYHRIESGFVSFDRVIGGGVVPEHGHTICIAGAPGLGKSTVLQQAANGLAKYFKVMYASGEQTKNDILATLKRINCMHRNLLIMVSDDLEKITAKAEEFNVKVLIVDSVSCVKLDAVNGSPGNPSQIKACAKYLVNFAKMQNDERCVMMVSHVTKSGGVAGPRFLEHIVDTMLFFEGDDKGNMRKLRASKNRLGSTAQVCEMQMSAKGLIDLSKIRKNLNLVK
jgi:integrase/archaellum biogenesis ATPase FlaH